MLKLEVEPGPHVEPKLEPMELKLEMPVEPMELGLSREEKVEPVRLEVVEVKLEGSVEPVWRWLALE